MTSAPLLQRRRANRAVEHNAVRLAFCECIQTRADGWVANVDRLRHSDVATAVRFARAMGVESHLSRCVRLEYHNCG